MNASTNRDLRLLTQREAAEIVHLEERMFKSLVAERRGPRPIQIGRRRFFTLRILNDWVSGLEADTLPEVTFAKAKSRPKGILSLSKPEDWRVLRESVRHGQTNSSEPKNQGSAGSDPSKDIGPRKS